MRILQFAAGLALVCIAVAGCNFSSSNPSNASNLDGSKYLLGSEPEGGQDVIEVRKTAQNDDEVVIVGKIGGSVKPWADGQAAFWIVDRSIKSCRDIDEDHCATPWDYCCEPNESLAPAMALVKVVDENGAVVSANAKELLGLKELDTVVARGTAERDMDGNLNVLVTSVYVRN